MGRHIPGNPSLVPRNMVGAAGLRLANWLYQVAPKDGTAIGTFVRGKRVMWQGELIAAASGEPVRFLETLRA